ncbi:MAG: NIPSNAP family protein [Notoacmeibacter sp.]|nr:NIPSNAP family protein [Notoacmeibacter sp.]
MIHELRTYVLRPGQAMAYLELFRTLGVARVTHYLPMGGYWLTDSGRLNVIHHLWFYESLEERAAARAAFAGDAIWNKEFVPAAFPLILSQTNAMMRLERGSPEMEAAVAGRKTVCENQQPGEPAFAPGLLNLSSGQGGLPERQGAEIAAWRVVSGDRPGRWVRLTRPAQMSQPPEPEGEPDWSELLRPLSLSPLR